MSPGSLECKNKTLFYPKIQNMATPFKWFIITFFALNFNLSKAFTQSDPKLINALNEQLIPLKTVSEDLDFMDFDPLNSILKEKQIIALGEATHGTHEFFFYKQQLLAYLVKKIGIKTIVLEADFSGSQTMNDYIVNGKGTAEQAILEMGFYGITQEFVDLVKWLKTYNDTQLPENKVNLYGCDMQYPVYAAKKIKDYLVQNNLLTPALNIGFEAMNKYYPGLTGKEKTAISTTITNLSALKFEDPDTAKNALYKRDLRALQQFADAQSKGSSYKQSDARDQYMAENTDWIYHYTKQNKLVLWQHNQHISRTKSSTGLIRMGNFLAETFKDKYYALGFDFYSGAMRSYDLKLRKKVDVALPTAKIGSSAEIFSQCKVPNFILDFKTASVNPIVSEFLNSKIQSVAYGAGFDKGQTPYYLQHKLSGSYDALIFIRDTKPSIDMKIQKNQ